jgi:hypothetical protein
LKLSLELRLKIYEKLFTGLDATPEHGYAANRSPYRLQCLDPFLHAGSGLILTNRQLLNEVADLLYVNSGLSFARPSQGLLFLSLTQSRLSQLSTLDLTVPAFETRPLEPMSLEPRPLEPIFKLLVENEAPLKSLILRLTPSYPGRISYPVPMYLIPRYAYEAEPIHDNLYTRSPRYPYVRTHSVEAIESVPTCKSWLGKLDTIRCLKVRGQPEFGTEFELAVLKLYLKMVETANREGKGVVLSKDNGSKGHEYYFEVWIEPAVVELDPRKDSRSP